MQKQQGASNHLKNYPQTYFQKIEESIKILELTFRLQYGFRKNLIDQRCFTDAVVIDLASGIGINSDTFDEQERDVQFHNLVLSAIAAMAIAVDTTLDEIFLAKDPEKKDNIGALRAFFYMLRNACSHDIINPYWRVKNKYQNVYTTIVPKEIMIKGAQGETFPEKKFIFDFGKLNGHEVRIEDFGGIVGLVTLAIYAASLAQKKQGL